MVTLLTVSPAVWVLLGMIALPIIVFGTIKLNADGFFEKFKKK